MLNPVQSLSRYPCVYRKKEKNKQILETQDLEWIWDLFKLGLAPVLKPGVLGPQIVTYSELETLDKALWLGFEDLFVPNDRSLLSIFHCPESRIGSDQNTSLPLNLAHPQFVSIAHLPGIGALRHPKMLHFAAHIPKQTENFIEQSDRWIITVCEFPYGPGIWTPRPAAGSGRRRWVAPSVTMRMRSTTSPSRRPGPSGAPPVP